MATIDQVRDFWNSNPLWTGEASLPPGSREFFEEHDKVYAADCFAGAVDERMFPERHGKFLDVGCGIGFWPPQYWKRGFRDITAVDISASSLALAKERSRLAGVEATFQEENAEHLSFADNTFDHVNCHGVVHHTVSPEGAVSEIHRVLKPGGTAMISVYYKNVILRNLGLLHPFISAMGKVGARLSGRGREGIYSVSEINELVRLYDGADNPIGIAYDRKEFRELLGPGFRVDEVFFHFFPARSLPIRTPLWLHKILDRRLPFMIFAKVTKI